MHGRKREDPDAPGLSAEARAARAAKIAKYNAAKGAMLSMRAAHQHDAQAFALTKTLIELNPDFYTLWNYRKEIVLDFIDKESVPSSEPTNQPTNQQLQRGAAAITVLHCSYTVCIRSPSLIVLSSFVCICFFVRFISFPF
jgi:geranylgeranyl transferase type-2 subunit alpha